MSDTRFLLEVTPRGILSFGPDTEPIQLSALNVLIGANGSGKSNLIDVIGLIRATAGDLQGEFIENGGIDQWLWKGQKGLKFSIEVGVQHNINSLAWTHYIDFSAHPEVMFLEEERITNLESRKAVYQKKNLEITIFTNENKQEKLLLGEINSSQSVISQLRDPFRYPLLYNLSFFYPRIRIYREWSFGRKNLLRTPKPTDSRNDFLAEDYSNLGLVLSRSGRNPEFKNAILEGLRGLYQGLTGFEVVVEGGTTQIFITEGKFTIPATRLSDGTLRYLCLLAILCDPKPAPLICIEEPELGLHPDILTGLAQLLLTAATRTQLIVTTHSEILIDALTDHPESVLVCEKTDGQTQIKRLETDALKTWLTEYRLGQLWMRGQLGGTRW